MTADDRRSTDREFERVWSAIDRLAQQATKALSTVDTHIAVCTKGEEARIADRAQMRADIAETKAEVRETKAAVQGLVKIQNDKAAALRFVKRLSGWASGTGAAVAATWAFVENVWPTLSKIIGRQAVVLLIAGSALAHDDDPVIRDLQTPSGGSCCHDRDCRLTDDWDLRAGAYVTRVGGAWREVPPEIVLRQQPHPSGRAVLCIDPSGRWLCFLPGAPQT